MFAGLCTCFPVATHCADLTQRYDCQSNCCCICSVKQAPADCALVYCLSYSLQAAVAPAEQQAVARHLACHPEAAAAAQARGVEAGAAARQDQQTCQQLPGQGAPRQPLGALGQQQAQAALQVRACGSSGVWCWGQGFAQMEQERRVWHRHKGR